MTIRITRLAPVGVIHGRSIIEEGKTVSLSIAGITKGRAKAAAWNLGGHP